ncbi:sulfate adenylyltransferase [Candidatus Woesearchaeota archaeon CG_4_10_14_0_2_um_filter_57_5]|nr:MAG: hypothetical protein AUJ68_07195 [Candidatus Woesearchaeota archaeon CG1_02_57_44]PIN69800.1 MAG: sulfate adenylyltransferase [Candidatus Woesearchaeota archaeon CG11_big_fil_rev_8_21_14_0_20_57_5]PIZ50138.1 MAG: sulfate adenylyltransferase [Candidatus Woesearchaeota archaeon CG_4_10_14_0_2_um_filter_57_5]
MESDSIYILREAKRRFRKPALLWSMGKDSTTLLWLCRKAFFGSVPMPVLHLDTGFKFPEMYAFRDKLAAAWDLDLFVIRDSATTARPEQGRFACCMARKTDALKMAIKEHGFDALIVGIRRDEHGIRNKERYFSPRRDGKWAVSGDVAIKMRDPDPRSAGVDAAHVSGDAPVTSEQDAELAGWHLFATDFTGADHVRIHPLLHWTELDVWRYVRDEGIPVAPLYFAVGGKRYRSLGCMPCTHPVASTASTVDEIITELERTRTAERDGRSQDKEEAHMMERLRSLGYL